MTCLVAAATCLVPCSVVITAALVARWISPRIRRTSTVAFFDCPARLFTSLATTANPRPCSPARAASTAALSARRLVCSASSFTVAVISPMACACSASAMMLSATASTCPFTWVIAATDSSRAWRLVRSISLARWAACSDVWATSSIVVTVSATAAEVSLAPDAC